MDGNPLQAEAAGGSAGGASGGGGGQGDVNLPVPPLHTHVGIAAQIKFLLRKFSNVVTAFVQPDASNKEDDWVRVQTVPALERPPHLRRGTASWGFAAGVCLPPVCARASSRA